MKETPLNLGRLPPMVVDTFDQITDPHVLGNGWALIPRDQEFDADIIVQPVPQPELIIRVTVTKL